MIVCGCCKTNKPFMCFKLRINVSVRVQRFPSLSKGGFHPDLPWPLSLCLFTGLHDVVVVAGMLRSELRVLVLFQGIFGCWLNWPKSLWATATMVWDPAMVIWFPEQCAIYQERLRRKPVIIRIR